MTETRPTTHTVHHPQSHQNTVLWLLALAMFLVVLDSAIINVALPAIKSAMHFTTASLQWVLTGYVLTFGGFLMLGGRTADLYGRRRVLIAGIVGFIAFSLLAGLATTAPLLIAARALQGLAGAFMAPTALSILLATFPEGPERNHALSVWSIVASGGAAAGVFLGGLLTQYLGWRWCFFVNVPVGLAAIYFIRRYVPAHIQEASDKNLDVPGAVLVTGGLMSLVYALTLASQQGWTAPATLISLGISAALLAGFLINETRAPHPLMPLSIFRIRNVSGGNLMMLPIVAGALGMFFFVSLFIQNVLNYPPSQTGLAFLPIPVLIGFISYHAPKLLMKFGLKPLLITGTALTTFGTFLMSFIGTGTSYFTGLLPIFLILACGFGISFVAITVAATTGVPGPDAGLASGLINTSQQIGSALGLAILAVVATATTTAAAADGHSAAAASVLGYQRAFLTAALLMLVALFVGIFVIRAPGDQHPAAPTPN
jgi:EmrB/QacA subfamily drug resistance transporter